MFLDVVFICNFTSIVWSAKALHWILVYLAVKEQGDVTKGYDIVYDGSPPAGVLPF